MPAGCAPPTGDLSSGPSWRRSRTRDTPPAPVCPRNVIALALVTLAAACAGGSRVVHTERPPADTAAAPAASSVAPAPVESADAVALPSNAGAQEDSGAGAEQAPDASSADDATAAAQPEQEAWCPEGVEVLPGPICAAVPDSVAQDASPTLVIFLHGVTNVGSGWQLGLIQGMSRYAQHQHFALLAPRAPRHTSADGKDDVYAWRTAGLGSAGEDALLQSWADARDVLEQRMGRRFERVFVMGFSSGAYYVSSLALRGRLPVDGYAAFAGGSAPFSRSMIAHVAPRVPIFVGYGLRDKAGSHDARGLVSALRSAHWKFREMAVRHAGHTITTSQFTTALAFLRAAADGAKAAAPEASAGAVPSPPPRKSRVKAPASKPPRKSSKHRGHPAPGHGPSTR